MRHYRFYILFVAVLTLSGCADFLDRDPLEQASENTFWKTEADVEKGVNALYPLFMGHRTKRILRIERKEYQTY